MKIALKLKNGEITRIDVEENSFAEWFESIKGRQWIVGTNGAVRTEEVLCISEVKDVK